MLLPARVFWVAQTIFWWSKINENAKTVGNAEGQTVNQRYFKDVLIQVCEYLWMDDSEILHLQRVSPQCPVWDAIFS